MSSFSPNSIEKKWKEKWLSEKLYKTTTDKSKKKFYSLYSFPYPSGSGLHVGHVEGMVANDIVARYYRMKDYNVTLPMGWDSFGLPAENYAIKTGIHPKQSTEDAVKTFIDQINNIGISVDWDKEVGAHREDYYKWTQWIFLQLYKAGLAYKDKASVNWCPKDQTVLANEQVIDGKCERCDTLVEQKEMSQWFFKITDYADRLYHDLDKVDWPHGTKQMQRNWIGKSEGSIVNFKIRSGNDDSTDISDFNIFTTRIDTIFGATYCAIAPENKVIEDIKSAITNLNEVEEYINVAKNKTDLQRQTQKEKTGVKLEGIFAINPFDQSKIPVFVVDYVLNTYGTGAIMAVPAHDQRDFEFATKFNVEVKNVISPQKEEFICYFTKEWSNNFNKFLEDIKLLNPIYLKKNESEVIFKFGSEFINKFIDIAIESIKGQYAWIDAVSEKEAVVIFGDNKSKDFQTTEVNRIPKFMEDKECFNQMKEFNPGVAEYKNIWEMYYNSDYKEKVCFAELGTLEHSGDFSGHSSQDATVKMQEFLANNNIGEKKTNYKLRDWLVSRQRYWGCPIPIVYDPEGNPHAIEEKDLPLKLPEDVDFKPTGESPILGSASFKQLAEERYGKGWHFEADTMDTFVDSSWYFFRYVSDNLNNKIAEKEDMNYWLPTDLYMIGAEHTVLHLMYSRFFTKFFFDQKMIDFDEPFYKMRHMGTILGPDGRKMSKRWGNVINPNDEINKYGADTIRMYEMFMGPLEDSKPWNDSTQSGVFRFLTRVWNSNSKVAEVTGLDSTNQKVIINKLVKKVTEDIESLSFNTSVAKFMEVLNNLNEYNAIDKEVWAIYIKLLAPFAPFITEELWELNGYKYSIHNQPWPIYNPELDFSDTVKISVQVNGKFRANLEVTTNLEQDEVLKIALRNENIKKFVVSEPKKIIFVKNKVLNIVC